jgi:hypothetical protein
MEEEFMSAKMMKFMAQVKKNKKGMVKLEE